MSKNKTSGSLHITKKVDYGLFLLAILSQNKKDSLSSIKTIADENKLSFTFLQKVAGLLLNANMIEAIRGKYGGYKLSKPVKKITVKEVIEALDGEIALTTCLKANAKEKYCKRMAFCPIHKGLGKINKEIMDSFLSKTLDKIIA